MVGLTDDTWIFMYLKLQDVKKDDGSHVRKV
jgi:hypothetical protein